MIAEFAALYERDLRRLIAEIELYPDEASLWALQGEIANSAGTLALHLAGNLRQFVGEDLGGVPFERDRPAEFSRRDVPRAELIEGLHQTLSVVQEALAAFEESRLGGAHPRQLPGFPEDMSSRSFLVHLYGHLNYHLGQINYHRRLLGHSD